MAVESHLNCRRCGEGLCEADHAHVIRVLLQTASALVTAVQTGQAGLLVLHSSAGVAARVCFAASQLGVLLGNKAREGSMRFSKRIKLSSLRCLSMTQTNLAVWVGADAAHRRQLGSIPRATEPAGVRAAGGWFTCKSER